MAKKPNIRTLEKLEELNAQISELYEKKRELTKKILETYGEGEFLYELETPTEKGEKFVRYKLIDNLEAFKTGNPMWKSTQFERFGYECRYLKNQPK
jgi:hypothetical protein